MVDGSQRWLQESLNGRRKAEACSQYFRAGKKRQEGCCRSQEWESQKGAKEKGRMNDHYYIEETVTDMMMPLVIECSVTVSKFREKGRILFAIGKGRGSNYEIARANAFEKALVSVLDKIPPVVPT